MATKITAPFFEIGPKSYLYGDEILELALAADAASAKYGVDIIFTCPVVDIRRVKDATKHIHVFAPHMDPIPVGRGLADILPESLVAAGAEGVMLNHVEKPVTFDVTVNYIQGETIVPELNQVFVIRYTTGLITSVEEFEKKFREDMQAELDQKAESAAMNTLWTSVVDNSEVKEYPEQHVLHYYGELMGQYEYYASYYSMDLATVMSLYGATEESVMETAQTYAKQDMVLYAIVGKEGIAVTEDEYTAKINEIASSAGTTAQAVEDYYGKDYIMESMLWDKVIKQLYDWADVTEA